MILSDSCPPPPVTFLASKSEAYTKMRNAKVVAQYILSGISVVYCDYGVCQSTLSQKKKASVKLH